MASPVPFAPAVRGMHSAVSVAADLRTADPSQPVRRSPARIGRGIGQPAHRSRPPTPVRISRARRRPSPPGLQRRRRRAGRRPDAVQQLEQRHAGVPRGCHPSILARAELSISGTAWAMSTQPGGVGVTRRWKAAAAAVRSARGRYRTGRASRRRPTPRCVEDRLGGDVERAARLADDGAAVGVGHVVGVDGLKAQSCVARHDGDPSRAASGLGRNGPANRRRISDAAPRWKIRPGAAARRARRELEPRTRRAAARPRPCGASRTTSAPRRSATLSSTRRSLGPREYAPTEEA